MHTIVEKQEFYLFLEIIFNTSPSEFQSFFFEPDDIWIQTEGGKEAAYVGIWGKNIPGGISPVQWCKEARVAGAESVREGQ